MKIGCNTVLFASVDLETALSHVAFAGYDYVELAAIKGMCEHLTPDLGAEETRKVTALLAEHGLTATAIEAATTDRDRLRGVFDVAQRLGIPIVNIGSGGTTDDEDSTKQAIEHIAGLADLAAEHGLTLAVKPHVGQAIYNGRTALRLMDEITNPALGLNFDPSHLYRADEQPEDIVHTWGARIVTSHFRDCGSRERAVGPPESPDPRARQCRHPGDPARVQPDRLRRPAQPRGHRRGVVQPGAGLQHRRGDSRLPAPLRGRTRRLKPPRPDR